MTKIRANWLKEPATQQVCALLETESYQALFVGGCVRNTLLNAPVADIDLATDARPEVVITLAEAAGVKAIPTGIDHGTVTLLSHGTPIEVTTFRRDVATDGRRATVAYASDVAEDARRRDFTMNALYARADGTLVDPLGGLTDLKARRVRFIDDPAARIQEDYLRILRFFRFHAWYGDPAAGIDADGLAACAAHVDGLDGLSRERVGAELLKLLSAPDPAPAVASMAASGALLRILAGASAEALAPLIHLELGLGLAPDPLRRLAALGGPDPSEPLRLSRTQSKTLHLLSQADGTAAELGYRHGAENALNRLCILAAQTGQAMTKDVVEAVNHGAAQVFPLCAADLMPMLQGPKLGAALATAEARWIASGFTLTKADLLA